MALDPGEYVFVSNLFRGKQYNGQVGIVGAKKEDDERYPIRLLNGTVGAVEGNSCWLSIKRENLRRARGDPEERQLFLDERALEQNAGMQVLRGLFEKVFGSEVGLSLKIASFLPAKQIIGVLSGFANGSIVRNWSRQILHPPSPCSSPATTYPMGYLRPYASPPLDSQHITGGIARIDCAVVDCGMGLFVVAGGCNGHPSATTTEFLRSAFLFDALTYSVHPLPPMRSRRHGCSGCFVDGKIYVLGGDYLNRESRLGGALESNVVVIGETIDVDHLWRATAKKGGGWQPWTVARNSITTHLQEAAFCPVTAISGRIVVLIDGLPCVFFPRFPDWGWCQAEASIESLRLQQGLSAASFGADCMVVMDGRDGSGGSHSSDVFAFMFAVRGAKYISSMEKLKDLNESQIVKVLGLLLTGAWARLGRVSDNGHMGGSLVCVEDSLFVSGGYSDSMQGALRRQGTFSKEVFKWNGTLSTIRKTLENMCFIGVAPLDNSFTRLVGLEISTAMHAHRTIAIPFNAARQ